MAQLQYLDYSLEANHHHVDDGADGRVQQVMALFFNTLKPGNPFALWALHCLSEYCICGSSIALEVFLSLGVLASDMDSLRMCYKSVAVIQLLLRLR